MKNETQTETRKKQIMQPKDRMPNGVPTKNTGATKHTAVPQPLKKKVVAPVESDEDNFEEMDEINVSDIREPSEDEFEEISTQSSGEEEEEPVEEAPKPAPRKPVPHKEVPRVMNGSGKHQAVTPTQTKSVSTERSKPMEASGALKNDLILPSVLLMQGLSDLVAQRKAFAGQIVRSPSGQILGGIQKPGEPSIPVDLIPLSMAPTWTIFTKDGNKWRGSEPRNDANDTLPWEFENEEGEECKRLKTINLIGLLSQDLVNQTQGVEVDEDGIPQNLDDVVLLPVALSFRSTSFVAGKSVSTFFEKIRSASQTYPDMRPYHFTLPINCTEESNDDGSWYVFNVGTPTKTPKEFQKLAGDWYTQVKPAAVHIEDESVSEQKTSQNMKAQGPKRTIA